MAPAASVASPQPRYSGTIPYPIVIPFYWAHEEAAESGDHASITQDDNPRGQRTIPGLRDHRLDRARLDLSRLVVQNGAALVSRAMSLSGVPGGSLGLLRIPPP